MKENKCRTSSRRLAVVGVLAGALLLFGCPGGEEQVQPKVGANDADINVNSTVVRALEDQPFTFASGEALSPALADQLVRLTFTNTATDKPNFTVTAPTVRGTDGNAASASGTVEFGSCTFIVTATNFGPNFRGLRQGDRITVEKCSVLAKTRGVPVDVPTKLEIALVLQKTTSNSGFAVISINSLTGEVTLNSVLSGHFVTLTIVTGTGGG